MDFISWALCGLITIVCLLLARKWLSSPTGKLPPGPWGLPFIGSPWYLGREMHVLFTELSKIYGDVLSVNILGERMVVFSTGDSIRKAFGSPDTGQLFSGRPPVPDINEYMAEATAFIAPTVQWSKQRKLIHNVLNLHGEGGQAIDEAIADELSHMIEWLEKKEGAVNLDHVIYPSLINGISILLKGKRYEYGSPVLTNMEEFDEEAAKALSPTNTLLISLLPFIKQLPIGPGKHILANRRGLEQFHRDFFDECKATYDPELTRGMIDHLFHRQEETRLQDGQPWPGDHLIKAISHEMVVAGTVTTRGALTAFFLIILHKPEVTRRIQQEIDVVIGRSRLVRIGDRNNLPYTMASLFELLRYISHAPLLLPHVTTEDATFGDYSIPKGTTLFANAWSAHHDEDFWPNPWEFKPERFLDEQQNLLPTDHPNRKNLLPFGTGRRSCIGEMFSRSRIFVIIANLLQRFDFSRDDSRPLPSLDPRTYQCSVVLSPPEYFVCVTPRH
ncbi:cytochrome P450 2C42-like [Liolophura sinensis]|uniref:cytochrome P450 2C42-like n=1 Tax=Liolophura sinensis TaxID=3198878 RepID=UPI003158A29B